MSAPADWYAIVGPTGVGKTAMAIALAQRRSIEVVSCDSMAIFRGLDIGTSKPTAAERAQVPHHLIDVADPADDAARAYDAQRFALDAESAARDIRARGNAPVLVGGTGFWLRALEYGLAPMPEICPEVRVRVREELEALGSAALHARLGEIDPELARRLPPTDTQRVVRGLEVAESTGVPLSEFQRRHGFSAPRVAVRKIGLTLPRPELYQRIDARAAAMVREGLADELDRALRRGVPMSARPLQTPGYKDALAARQNQWTEEELVAAVAQSHRRYAKRQMTWFKKDETIQWFAPGDVDGIEAALFAASL